MRFLLLIISMYAIILPCKGQSLQLISNKGVKTFKPGTYFEIITADKCDECDWTKYMGAITQVGADSLSILATHIESARKVGSTIMTHSVQFPHETGNLMLAKNDILFLEGYKSQKARSAKDNIAVIGGLLLITGAATAIHGIALPNASGRKTLLISGGVQIMTGIVLAIKYNASTKYYFRDRQDVWYFKQ